MKLNILVVTEYSWSTRVQKNREAKAILQLGGFEEISITTKIRNIGTPKLNSENSIDSDWFENTITKDAREKGYNFVVWQFSRADGARWGLESRIHGLNFRDGDFYGESWICCDERSVWRFNDGTKRSEYPKSIAHEIGHELTRQGFTKLEVHDYDYTEIRNKLELFYMDMAKEQKTVLGSLLFKLAELRKQLFFVKQNEISDLRPLVKRKSIELTAKMAAIGLPIRITQGYRSIEEQNKLYAQGRTSPGAIVTKAKGGESLHNYGVAFDIVFTELGYNALESQWQKLGSIGESLGLEWGGRWTGFVDRPHFQLTLGYTLKEYQDGNVDYNKFK